MVYVTSDLHGYPLEKFQELLKKADFSDRDFCFVLGDVIDRGPEGLKLLKWLMMQPNMELILGNHECMLLTASFLFENGWNDAFDDLSEEQLAVVMNWIENGGGITIKDLSECDMETISLILEYLRDAPLYDSVCVNDRDFVLVHGGLGNFSAEKVLEDYSINELIWARPALTDTYFGDITTILGHTPTEFYGEEYAGKAIVTPTWINIDTGAACGGAPMLLRLDDMKEFYV